MREAVARSDKGSAAAARGPRRSPRGAGVLVLDPGGRTIGVVVVVGLVLDAVTDSALRLDVGGAFDTRGVGTRGGGAVAPVVMTQSCYAITTSWK